MRDIDFSKVLILQMIRQILYSTASQTMCRDHKWGHEM